MSRITRVSVTATSHTFTRPRQIGTSALGQVCSTTRGIKCVPHGGTRRSGSTSNGLVTIIVGSVNGPICTRFIGDVRRHYERCKCSVVVVSSRRVDSIRCVVLVLARRCMSKVILTSSHLSSIGVRGVTGTGPLILVGQSIRNIGSIVTSACNNLRGFLRRLYSLKRGSLACLSKPTSS